jgi:hypothetical protein
MKKIIFVEDPDPDPYENVTDLEHCKIGRKGKRDDQTQWSQLELVLEEVLNNVAGETQFRLAVRNVTGIPLTLPSLTSTNFRVRSSLPTLVFLKNILFFFAKLKGKKELKNMNIYI